MDELRCRLSLAMRHRGSEERGEPSVSEEGANAQSAARVWNRRKRVSRILGGGVEREGPHFVAPVLEYDEPVNEWEDRMLAMPLGN